MSAPLNLAPHPNTPLAWLASLEVTVAFQPDGALALAWRLQGDLARLRVPLPGPLRHSDGLWRHTCCEAFIATADAPAYHEFNFSPSGAWAAYRFTAYREGSANLALADPGIVCRMTANQLTLEAVIAAAALPPGLLRLGMCAVVEDVDGGIAYFALCHPPGRPDFHHFDSFALELARP